MTAIQILDFMVFDTSTRCIDKNPLTLNCVAPQALNAKLTVPEPPKTSTPSELRAEDQPAVQAKGLHNRICVHLREITTSLVNCGQKCKRPCRPHKNPKPFSKPYTKLHPPTKSVKACNLLYAKKPLQGSARMNRYTNSTKLL